MIGVHHTHVPTATYRLQLHGGVTFDDAAATVDYLAELGIGALYLSPIMTAPEGASHGYHILDPNRVDEQLGGDEGLSRLHGRLAEHAMGLLLDIVPNHLAASVENPYWRSVLADGRQSPFAAWFDIDWEAGAGKIVLPVLGRPLDDVLAAGDAGVVEGSAPADIEVDGVRLPLAPGTRSGVPDPRDGAQPDAWRALLDEQHYRPVFWRTGVEELNYRRFFDITDLVGVRVEDPEVFDGRHRRLLELVEETVVTGLRVDHVDGLRDPTGYLEQLSKAASAVSGSASYLILVEKILEGDENLPEQWPIAGTTGYEFLVVVNGVQVDPAGRDRLDAAYRDLTGRERRVTDVLYARKRAVLRDLFSGEVDRLVRRLDHVVADLPGEPEVSRAALREALVAVTAAFPAYRTYLRAQGPERPGPHDRAAIDTAFREARRRSDPSRDATRLLERILTLDMPIDLPDPVRSEWLDTVLTWQQLTGPAMAKGFEDTTLYRENTLISLNEVGADAESLVSPPDADTFHERTARRARRWPHALNATSTHDTKRSEDVRARLNVLSEDADRFADAIAAWIRRHEGFARDLGDHLAPDANEAWLVYQTLLGMWPLDAGAEATVRDRLHAFVEKAAREAKLHTSWLDPDEAHEAGLHAYVDAILDDETFVAELRAHVDAIALPGAVNSLAQVIAKIAAPGVPDFYQATELWDFSLVDPDNRRPVDWQRRRAALDDLRTRATDGGLLAELRDSWRDGRVKLYVTWAGLQARAARPALFTDGDYVPLGASGARAPNVLAFARRRGDDMAVALAARRTLALGDAWPVGDLWGDTRVGLPAHARLRDALTGRVFAGAAVRLAEALSELPVALLVPHGQDTS